MAVFGAEALEAIEQADKPVTPSNRYSPFPANKEYLVKFTGLEEFMFFYSYSYFGRTKTFVPEVPSVKDEFGNPIDNLTVWDKAYLHYKEKSKEFNDEMHKKAEPYRPKPRVAVGMFDLNAGKEIVIDLSRNQASHVITFLKQQEQHLDRLAFRISKNKSGEMSVIPVMFLDTELTEEQLANFNSAPKEPNFSKFEGINFEADEDEQLRRLIQTGFDVSLIGIDEETVKTVMDDGDDGTEEGNAHGF